MDQETATSSSGSDPLFSVEGKVAIVTGASSGLGRRFVHCLAERGARVVAVARRAEALEELAAEVGDQVLAAPADVTDEHSVRAAVERAAGVTGTVDILVNNAGITRVGPAESETPDDFAAVLDANLIGAYRFAHHAGRLMLQAGQGSIVNVASINGLVASWSIPQVGYCASKSGVLGMTRELAAQWAARGVRVNAIAPGYFRTELTEELFTSQAGARRLTRMPMARGGAGNELDGALVYLASDGSSYVTGQTLVVDGGWTIV